MRRPLAVGALLLLVAGACGSAQPAPGRLVRIEMTDFAFAPKEIRVKAGEIVTLELPNKGVVAHELMAGRGEILHAGGYAEDLFTGLEVAVSGQLKKDHGHGGFSVMVDPGKTARATFTVPAKPGTYEIACFEPGHYASGMVGKLVIEQP